MDLFKLNAKRRSWEPNNPAPMSETAIAPITISRCLSLTPLEPAVAAFLKEGLSRSEAAFLSPELVATLERNIEDEVRHELALNRATAALKVKLDFTAQAAEFIAAWEALPDNPVTKTAVLECGVFFVILPLYQQFGSPSLKITSASISGDERLHVNSHRYAAQQLKAPPSKQLNALRRDTVAWLAQDLWLEMGGNWTTDRMVNNSDSLMSRGVSDLVETQTVNVNAPYEINNRNLEQYA
jgi:hypothetical protein